MHVKTVHEPGIPRPGGPIPDAQKQETFKCRDCGKEFLRFYDMNRHKLTHSNKKPHKCPRCGRSFARADALMRHQRPENGCHRRFLEEVEAAKNRVILKASGHLAAQRPGLIGPEFIPIVPHHPGDGSSHIAPSTLPPVGAGQPMSELPGARPPPAAPGIAAGPAMPPADGLPPPATNAWQIIQELTSRISVLEMRLSQQDSRIAFLEYHHQKASTTAPPQLAVAPPQPPLPPPSRP